MTTDAKPRLSMIMLGTADPDRSAAFYADTLGFALRSRFEEFAFLDAGGVMLGLSGDLMRTRPRTGAEPVEVVIAVESVTRSFDALRRKGVDFLREPRVVDGTNYAATFEDPDGHLLSLFGPR